MFKRTGGAMEKKEVRKLFRSKMKKMGFSVNAGYYFKILKEDYLISMYLDACPYGGRYYVEYSVLYLPDAERMPYEGFCDWDSRFLFTKDPMDDLSNYSIESLKVQDKNVNDYFDYEFWDLAHLDRALDENIERKFAKLYDKNYILNLYREDLQQFAMLPEKTIRKLMKRGGFDEDEVWRLKKIWQSGGYWYLNHGNQR